MTKKYQGSKPMLVVARIFFGIYNAAIILIVLIAGLETMVIGKSLLSDYRGTATQVNVRVVGCRTRGSGVKSPKWGECYVYARYNGLAQYVTMGPSAIKQYTPGSNYMMYQFGSGVITTDGRMPSALIVRFAYNGSVLLLVPAVFVILRLNSNRAKRKKAKS